MDEITKFQCDVWNVVKGIDIESAEERLMTRGDLKITDEYLDMRLEDDDTDKYLVCRSYDFTPKNSKKRICIHLIFGDNSGIVKDIEMFELKINLEI